MTDVDVRSSLSSSGAAAVSRARARPRRRIQRRRRQALARGARGRGQAAAGAHLADRARRLRPHGRIRADRRWSASRYFAAYLPPNEGLFWRYLVAASCDRRALDARVPDRRHLPGAGVPRPREAIHAAGLGLVGRVPDRHRRIVLRQSRRRCSRASGSAPSTSSASLALGRPTQALFFAGAQLDARRPPRPPHRHRRRRRARRALIDALQPAGRRRHRDRRRVRRPQRRPLRPTTAPASPSSARVDDLVEFAPPHPRRPRDLLAADHGGRPHPADAARSCGCCRSTSGSSAHTNKLRFRPRAYSYIGNVPVLDVFDQPIADWDVVIKWLFDKIVGGLALIAAAAGDGAGRASPSSSTATGPVLFRQKRYGFNNELIEVYKFRSMYTDTPTPTATKLVTKDDPRVTRVGRFIRKTCLDELPQLFNVVFKGNLSLVGPRPHAVQRQGREPALRRGRRRLFRPPPGQARHHRLGADQRLARRDRHAGEDPEARRARPLLHRELVGAVRPLHPADDAVRAAQDRERLLITASDIAAQAGVSPHFPPAPAYADHAFQPAPPYAPPLAVPLASGCC